MDDFRMLDARDDDRMLDAWLDAGGMVRLASYGVASIEEISDGHWVEFIPEAHWRFLEEDCKLFVDDGDLLFVHGNVPRDLSLSALDEMDLLWSPNHGGALHVTGKRLVCGHTARIDHLSFVDKGNIVVDTFACGRGPLTCVSTDERLAYQQFACGKRQSLRWGADFSLEIGAHRV